MVTHDGAGELSCCGIPMSRQAENATGASAEKHVPVLERKGGTVSVKVGAAPHPMEASHYIEWIEMISGPSLSVTGLKPGMKPEASFPVPQAEAKVRAYCNVHGLWSDRPSHK